MLFEFFGWIIFRFFKKKMPRRRNKRKIVELEPSQERKEYKARQKERRKIAEEERQRRQKKSKESTLNTLINKLPFELHYRGFDSGFKPYNFAGPGTKLDKRLDEYKRPKKHSTPVNRVDNSAYHHDLCYDRYNDTKTRNKVCDAKMLRTLKKVRKDKKARWSERVDAAVIEAIIGTKKKLKI